MKDIIQVNKDYFVKYPQRKGRLLQIADLPKGVYFDVDFRDEYLLLMEMVYNRNVNAYTPSDRLIFVFDDETIDTSVQDWSEAKNEVV